MKIELDRLIKDKTRFFIFAALLVVWTVIMIVLSSQNGGDTANTSRGMAVFFAKIFYKSPSAVQITSIHNILRKSAHIIMFAVFSALCCAVSENFINHQPRRSAYITTAIVTLFAFIDEAHKIPIDGRHFDLFDVMLNIIGGLAVVWIYYAAAARKNGFIKK